MINWIVENLTKEPSFLELTDAIERLGFPLQKINGDFKFKDISHYKNQKVIFNGSIEMCKHIRGFLLESGNTPVTYCTWKNYLCTKYYPRLSDYLFNDNYVMVPLKEIKKRLYFFYGVFGKESLAFIRPDDGDKTFKGSLIDIQDFDSFYEQVNDVNQLVIISTPKNILGEWRFVVSKYQDIIAVSSYKYQGLRTLIPSAPKGAIELCSRILKQGYHPDSVYCIDICQDNDGNYWLMELTSFSSAGLYACNKIDIVKRVSEIIENE